MEPFITQVKFSPEDINKIVAQHKMTVADDLSPDEIIEKYIIVRINDQLAHKGQRLSAYTFSKTNDIYTVSCELEQGEIVHFELDALLQAALVGNAHSINRLKYLADKALLENDEERIKWYKTHAITLSELFIKNEKVNNK